MKAKGSWILWSFILCFFFNGLIGVALYFPFLESTKLIEQYLKPLTTQKAEIEKMPEYVNQLVIYINDLLSMAKQYGTLVIWGVILTATLALWIALSLVGARHVKKAYREREEIKVPVREEKAEPKETTSPFPAFQVLKLLQRDGRFIDFIKEDLSSYEDHQVGAAVRSLQESWKKIIDEYFQLEPVLKEQEGSPIILEEGFDVSSIKLTGDVVGKPPFRGVIRHRGWKLVKINLPSTIEKEKQELVVAPAEVEIEKS